jgi:hypothetical protein
MGGHISLMPRALRVLRSLDRATSISLSVISVRGAGTRRRRPLPLRTLTRAWGTGSTSGDTDREGVYEETSVTVVARVSLLSVESWRPWYVVRLPAVLGRDGSEGTGGYSTL